jgi:2-oxoglutarate ferredoxin oxidoreductase subunit delta
MANSETNPPDPTGPRPKQRSKIEIKVSWCKGCGLCVDYCKLGVLEMKGPLPEVVKIEKCSRCMQCELICPDFAIRVTEDGQLAAEPADQASRGAGAAADKAGQGGR